MIMLEKTRHREIIELCLASPPVNALGVKLIQSLTDALQSAMHDDSCKAVVISGQSGIFSAGLDVREVLADQQSRLVLVRAFMLLQETLARSIKPVFAAITGHCPAGGAVISILCDYRIMAQGNFKIGLNEVQVGLYPGNIAYRIFERIVGVPKAAALLPRGVMMDSAAALAVGLVDEVVAPGQVIARTLLFATECLALPQQAYLRTRTLVRGDLVRLFNEPQEDLAAMVANGWVTEETLVHLRAGRD